MDMLRSASAWLAQARVDKLSETVMLQHFSDGEKSGAPVELHATRGRSLFRADDKYGVTIRIQSVDFIVPASELGNQFPEKGDEIYADGRVFEVLAPTQDMANMICATLRSTFLHYGYEGRKSTAGNLAFPFAPSDIPFGTVFEFSVYHLMSIPDGLCMFPIEYDTVGGQ